MNLQSVVQDGFTLAQWLTAIYTEKQSLKSLILKAAKALEASNDRQYEELAIDIAEKQIDIKCLEKELPKNIVETISINDTIFMAVYRKYDQTVGFFQCPDDEYLTTEGGDIISLDSEVMEGVTLKRCLEDILTHQQETEQDAKAMSSSIDKTFSIIAHLGGMPYKVSRLNGGKLEFIPLSARSNN